MSTELGKLMRKTADRDGLPANHSLRLMADRFDRATDDYFNKASISPKEFFAAWAKARRAWCDYSGEPLL